MLSDVIAWLQGKKTYIVMIIGVLVNGAFVMDLIDDKTVQLIDGILIFLGMGSIRAGISKGSKIGVLLSVLLLSACAPLAGTDLKDALSSLAQDRASACVQLGGGAGAGAIVPGPGIPISGGYGFFWFARANQPGSVVVIDSGGCKILHGVYKQSVEQKELQDLEDKLKAYDGLPKVLVVPAPEKKPEMKL